MFWGGSLGAGSVLEGRKMEPNGAKCNQMDQHGTRMTPQESQKGTKWSSKSSQCNQNEFKGTKVRRKTIQQIKKDHVQKGRFQDTRSHSGDSARSAFIRDLY